MIMIWLPFNRLSQPECLVLLIALISIQLVMRSLCDMNLIIVLLVFSCSCLQFSAAIDTITLARPINDSEAVISGGSVYKLGFFSPENSTLRYVGIWFNIPIKTLTVIWVANRDKPLNDSSGLLTMSEDGNLVVLNGRDEVIWSSGVSPSRPNSTAQLLDTGNLILRDSITGSSTWESFHQPYDSFVPNMEISTSAKEEIRVRSWKSPTDPSTGSFSIGINHPDAPELFIWNNTQPFWRSGPWNGRKFIGVPKMNNLYLDGYHLVDDNNGTVSLSFTYANQSVHLYYMLDSEGALTEKYWEQGMDDFLHSWLGQETKCDVYGMCGAFGSCNSSKSPICSCLEGYRPRNVTEWNTGNWSSGCIRSTPFKCERGESDGESGKEDGFLQLTMMKAPDFGQRLADLNNDTDCRSYCLNNCSCSAYIYDNEIGCMAWSGDLIDVQKFSYAGTDLYIHVAYAELAAIEKKKGKNITITITVSVIIGTIAAIICAFLAWKLMGERRVAKFMKFTSKTRFGDTMDEVGIQELPLFKFEALQTATNNFHLGNKLGQGGFGPVYKGKLLDGREIAVKRLLKSSGQGHKEFMTEVEVISKLQHRNLVRLLGCCAEGDEKMLIYEYMPNGSLDAILFDQQKREELDWKKRFNIMEGISRGLLYLHRDSRLKIIHRDIKASNVLLDEALNPKISDFGTARIFGGNEDKANTLRVVGTYGYMSPEYAMEGHFSEKSDVYSFGVLVLEIISGRKITSFHQDERSSSLLALAWRLWNEGSIIDLADPSIFDPSFEVEVVRCIHVGLLCVQELAKDRPAVSVVVSMLNSEIAELPAPKQPAFAHGRIAESTESSSQQGCSVGSVTITAMDGR